MVLQDKPLDLSLRGVSSVPFPFQFPFQLHCELVSSEISSPISSKYSELVCSDVILLNLKRDRTKIGLLFQVTHHIKIFRADCQLIPELTSS